MSADALARLPAEQARETLVSLAIETELVPELRAELAAALERLETEARATAALAPGRLAVRSSAVSEDGTISSFAGMHDTDVTAASIGLGFGLLAVIATAVALVSLALPGGSRIGAR